ncbi:acyl dehydratase [Streptomyces sp. 846.5]|nr:MaoC/PaaZ C-terminal domain-containing protein [Streptomyces sp. 846.5]TDT94139.1 acyl dehydratase [Streptomyces sp. 846.5]
MSINVEMIGTALMIQHYVGEITEPHHCRMVSVSDVFTPAGRSKVQVTWDLSVRPIDSERSVGDTFRAPSRTLTEAHAAAFQTVSADNHPVHYDSVWARRHGHTAPVVHALTITDLIPQDGSGVVATAATIHNQRGELVLSGQHKYLLRRPSSA